MKAMVFLSAAAIVFFAEAHSAANDARAASAMRMALDSSATWTMSRTLAGSDRALVSSGRVDCVAYGGITWRVTFPFQETIVFATNGVTFTDEDGERFREAKDMPHYADIRRLTDAFVSGETKSFDKIFEIASTGVGTNGWRLTFTPRHRDMRRLFASLELTGGKLPTQAVMVAADGGRTTIRFTESARER